jgi:hypothetical protein
MIPDKLEEQIRQQVEETKQQALLSYVARMEREAGQTSVQPSPAPEKKHPG